MPIKYKIIRLYKIKLNKKRSRTQTFNLKDSNIMITVIS
jgi:hypothetical protein